MGASLTKEELSSSLKNVDVRHHAHPFCTEAFEPADYEDYRIAQHQIVPRLWLGDLSAAGDPDNIAEAKISHVVNTLGSNMSKHRDRGVRYFQIDIPDHPNCHIGSFFEPVNRWIDAVFAASPEHRVLVHCAAGVSRSSTLVIAYIMHSMRLRVMDAYKLVKSKRGIIDPNPGFRLQLVQFDAYLFEGSPWPYAESSGSAVANAIVDSVGPSAAPTDAGIGPTSHSGRGGVAIAPSAAATTEGAAAMLPQPRP